VLQEVADLVRRRGAALETRGELLLRRGPYVILAVLDETPHAAATQISGAYVDLFDPYLGVVRDPKFAPGTRALLYDLADSDLPAPRIVAAAARVRDVRTTTTSLRCATRGPLGTRCRMRIQSSDAPTAVRVEPAAEVAWTWDAASGTTLVEFDNQGSEIVVHVALQ
jgi:hypothetical protein